jgi:hypothetical protein
MTRRRDNIRPCRRCGEPFLSVHGTRYCSDTCRATQYLSEPMQRCKACGKSFPTNRNQLYCSDTCRDAGAKESRSEWRQLPRNATCQTCHKPFTRRKGRVHFCSLPCRRVFRYAHNVCVACGKTFRRGKRRQKYCSLACVAPNRKVPPVIRTCANPSCSNSFQASSESRKKFCSHSCSLRFQHPEGKWKFPKCRNCGEDMPSNRTGNAKFCCDDCRWHHQAGYRTTNVTSSQIKTCANPECGKQFMPNKGWKRRKYCSYPCSVLGHVLRNAEKRRLRAQTIYTKRCLICREVFVKPLSMPLKTFNRRKACGAECARVCAALTRRRHHAPEIKICQNKNCGILFRKRPKEKLAQFSKRPTCSRSCGAQLRCQSVRRGRGLT